MLRAHPAGSALATALEPRFSVAAWRSPSESSTAQIPNQYEAMLARAATPISKAESKVIPCRLPHTLW
jgi:hypothetical protein